MADSSLVDVAVTGIVAYAETSEPAPVDADTPLSENWRDVGYISEDGITEARERSTTNIIAWQNAEVVRTVTTESSMTVSFTMIETNPNSLALYYGAEVAPDGSIEINPANSGGRRSFVIDYIDGDKVVRLYIPEGELTETGEQTLTSGGAVGYEVTITGYPSTLGYTAKKWYSALAGTGS
jgi:hypothetical protein